MTQTDAAADLTLTLETPFDAGRIDAIVARAFGPGRYAKTAERLRERAHCVDDLCFVARLDGALVGSVRLWAVQIGATPAVFLGPIAVEAGAREAGVGARLVEAALAAARAQGWPAVLLVGDAPYFGRFGFERAADVTLPGPVDARRVLIRMLADGPAPTGAVTPQAKG